MKLSKNYVLIMAGVMVAFAFFIFLVSSASGDSQTSVVYSTQTYWVGDPSVTDIDNRVYFSLFGEENLSINYYEDSYTPIQSSAIPADTTGFTWNGVNSDIILTTHEKNMSYDLKLSSIPSSNTFNFTFDYDMDLNWFFQGRLDDEENNYTNCNATDCWDSNNRIIKHRPENIVNSYAVYSNKRNGKYKTGKVFHILRPNVSDNSGDWIWGNLSYDETTKNLTVTVNQTWLNSASYPVTIDPTFGYETLGESGVAVLFDFKIPWQEYYTNTGRANLSTAFVGGYSFSASDPMEARVYIYEKDYNEDNSQLAFSSDIVNITIETMGWSNMPISGILNDSTKYIVVVTANDDQDSANWGRLAYDGVTWEYGKEISGSSFEAPVNLSDMVSNGMYVSAYVNYTEIDNCIDGDCVFGSDEELADINYKDATLTTFDGGAFFKWDIHDLCALNPTISSSKLEVYVSSVSGSPDNDLKMWYIRDEVNESSTASQLDAITGYNLTTIDPAFSNTGTGRSNITIPSSLVQEACDRGENLTIKFEDPDYYVDSIVAVLNTTASIVIGHSQFLSDDSRAITSKESPITGRPPRLFVSYTVSTGIPEVYLKAPEDNLISENLTQNFTCYIDDYDSSGVEKVSLWGNWSGYWHEAEVNSSGISDSNYTFEIDITRDYQPQSNKFDISASGNSEPSGIVWNGTHFFIVDSTDKKIYCYNSSGSYDSSNDIDISSDTTSPRDIAWNGTNFFVIDGDDNYAECYNSSGSHITSCSFNLSDRTSYPYGITTNGTDFYIDDFNAGRILHYDISGNYVDNITRQSLSTCGGTNTGRGLSTNKTRFLLNTLSGKVCEYNLTGSLIINYSLQNSATTITTKDELNGGILNDFWVADDNTNFTYNFQSTRYGFYDWNCKVYDLNSNSQFNDTNRSWKAYKEGLTLQHVSPANEIYNSTDGMTTFTCNATSSITPLTSAYINILKNVGGRYIQRVYNYSQATISGNNFSVTVNLTNGWYNWTCNATNVLGETNTTNSWLYKTGVGKVYLQTAVHTEPRGILNDQFNQVLDLSDFEEGGNIDGVFNTTFRHQYYDSYGSYVKYVWKLRMDQAICHSTTGCSSIIDAFLNDEWNYTSNPNIDGNYTYWNDSLGWHMHVEEWFNWTNYSTSGGDGPWQPADYWNQVFTMNGTVYREGETDQQTAEKILGSFILDSGYYPITSVLGWVGVTTQISNWYSDKVPFMYDNWYGSSSTDNVEPIENVWNWTNAPHEMYHPSNTDYQSPGDNTNTLLQCAPGGLNDNENQYQMINHSFYLASQGVDNILCHYIHSYSASGLNANLRTDVQELHECIDESIWGDGCGYSNIEFFVPKPDMKTLYPNIKYKYTTAEKMVREIYEKTDTTAPNITLWIDGDWAFFNSTEELWGIPQVAIRNGTNTYLLGGVDNGTNQWKVNISGYNALKIRAAGLDLAWNFGFSEIKETSANIVYPTSTNTFSATDQTYLLVNFTLSSQGVYLTSGVSVNKITIANSDCPLNGVATYMGSNIWQQNCTLPSLSGSNNLTINVTHASTGDLTDTENNSVIYNSCTYSGSGDWLIQCSDLCDINSAVDLGGNDLILNGTGKVFLYAPINNERRIIKDKNCILYKTSTFAMYW